MIYQHQLSTLVLDHLHDYTILTCLCRAFTAGLTLIMLRISAPPSIVVPFVLLVGVLWILCCSFVGHVLFVSVFGSCLRTGWEVICLNVTITSSPRHGRDAKPVPSLVFSWLRSAMFVVPSYDSRTWPPWAH
jgi:hypothetical protein